MRREIFDYIKLLFLVLFYRKNWSQKLVNIAEKIRLKLNIFNRANLTINSSQVFNFEWIEKKNVITCEKQTSIFVKGIY